LEIDYEALGRRIRLYRKKRGLTQQALASLAKIETSNVSHIERAATKVGLPTLTNIANALDVTLDDLMGNNIKKNRKEREDKFHQAHIEAIRQLLKDCDEKIIELAYALFEAQLPVIKKEFKEKS